MPHPRDPALRAGQGKALIAARLLASDRIC